MKLRTTSILTAALVAATVLTGAPTRAASDPDRVPVPFEANRGHVIYAANGERTCLEATLEQSVEMRRRAPGEVLQVLEPEKLAKARRGEATGLTIILRGTTQLDNFPSAKAAYIRAAETWEALIRTPVTVLIDVDFGPNRFGSPWPSGVLGSTDSQFGSFAYTWSGVRSRLISRASSDTEATFYGSLPSSAGVPTTEGTCTLVYIPSAVQRTLGLLDAVPDEDEEFEDLGPPPSIGFNSAFLYDFDPTNGIDSNKQDFNATALHEIGHALGFVSHAGLKELIPSQPVIITTWDVLRFRPGVTLGTFASAQRVTSSGGEHVSFNGITTTRLSTGRPNGTGGDGNQSSHWKDNVQNSNNYIGIMDPTGADGDLDQLTSIDLQTLNLIGWDVKGLVSADGVDAVLDGNTLTITGVATVANLILDEANVTILDAAGAELQDLGRFQIGAVGSSSVTLNIPAGDLAALRTAAMADVTLFDDRGNASETVRVNFADPDEGGPTVASLTYNGKKMKVTGTGFTGPVQIEVNGVVRSATVKIKSGGTKLQLKATPAALGLESGPNRIRFVSNSLNSNIFVINR